jgi:carboxyl-terminal processing protease
MNTRVTACIALTAWLGAAVPASSLGELQSEPADQEALPLDELRTFAEIFGRIKSDYVEAVDDRELLNSAIRGMLSGLDPHSAYLDGDEYRDLQVGTSGEFGGLGIEVGMEDGFVKVIAPIDDTPAQRAGLQAGDLIIRIDGKPVKGMGLDDAVKMMRGKPGTEIGLTVLREGTDRPFRVDLTRDIIHVASVKSRTLQPGFGYLRVAHFQSRTTEDLLKAVAALKEENDGRLAGLVLDLRNNPGGVLNSAVGVSDAFLSGGLIVYTKGRIDDSVLEFKAGPDDVLDGAPLVVLVNSGSASASEIVAGALQDHGRAIVMGDATFGKGSVQTIVPIDDATALKLTTARYYTPSGRSIQAQGIDPDIVLERGRLELAESPDIGPLKEADFTRHLDEDASDEAGEAPGDADEGGAQREAPEPIEAAPVQEGAAGAEAEQPLAVEDYQLNEALNVLRALTIYGAAKKG